MSTDDGMASRAAICVSISSLSHCPPPPLRASPLPCRPTKQSRWLPSVSRRSAAMAWTGMGWRRMGCGPGPGEDKERECQGAVLALMELACEAGGRRRRRRRRTGVLAEPDYNLPWVHRDWVAKRWPGGKGKLGSAAIGAAIGGGSQDGWAGAGTWRLLDVEVRPQRAAGPASASASLQVPLAVRCCRVGPEMNPG